MSIHLRQVTKKLRAVGAIRDDQSPRAAVMAIVQGTAKRYFDASSGMSVIVVGGAAVIGLTALTSNATSVRVVGTLVSALSLIAVMVVTVRLLRPPRESSAAQESLSGSVPAAARGYALAIVGTDFISLPVDLMSRPCAPVDTMPLTSIESVVVEDSKTFLGFRAARKLTVRYKDGHPPLFVEYLGAWEREFDSLARMLGSEAT